jgi:hypothetical protein
MVGAGNRPMRKSAEQENFPKSADDRFIDALVDENIELRTLVTDLVEELKSSHIVDDGHMYFFADISESQKQLIESIIGSA